MFKRVSAISSGHLLIRILICCLLCEQPLVNCIRNDLGAIVSDADQAFSEVCLLLFWNLSFSLSSFHNLTNFDTPPPVMSHELQCAWPIMSLTQTDQQAECTCQIGDQFDNRLLSACSTEKRCVRFWIFKTFFFFFGKAISTDLEHLLSFESFLFIEKPFLSFVMHFHTLSFADVFDGVPSCRAAASSMAGTLASSFPNVPNRLIVRCAFIH